MNTSTNQTVCNQFIPFEINSVLCALFSQALNIQWSVADIFGTNDFVVILITYFDSNQRLRIMKVKIMSIHELRCSMSTKTTLPSLDSIRFGSVQFNSNFFLRKYQTDILSGRWNNGTKVTMVNIFNMNKEKKINTPDDI